MSRINNIVQSIRALTLKPVVPFTQLSAGITTRLTYSMAKYCHNQIVWWQDKADDEDSSPEFVATARKNVIVYSRALASHLPSIAAAANFLDEGKSCEIKFDASCVDENGNPVEDISHETVVINSHPHAWAMGKLTDLGVDFDGVQSDADKSRILLVNYDQQCFQEACSYAALLVLVESKQHVLGNSEKNIARRADDMLIAANSVKLRSWLSALTEGTDAVQYERLVLNLLKGMRWPYRVYTWDTDGVQQETSYSTEQLINLFNELREQDEEDAERAADKAAAKAFKKEMRAIRIANAEDVRVQQKIALLTQIIAEKYTLYKSIGMSEAMIAIQVQPQQDQLAALTSSVLPPVEAPAEEPEVDPDAEFKASLAKAEAAEAAEREREEYYAAKRAKHAAEAEAAQQAKEATEAAAAKQAALAKKRASRKTSLAAAFEAATQS